MYAISLTDVIEPKFWRHNFRYAIIVLVIFGAIITPDGSGTNDVVSCRADDSIISCRNAGQLREELGAD